MTIGFHRLKQVVNAFCRLAIDGWIVWLIAILVKVKDLPEAYISFATYLMKIESISMEEYVILH